MLGKGVREKLLTTFIELSFPFERFSFGAAARFFGSKLLALDDEGFMVGGELSARGGELLDGSLRLRAYSRVFFARRGKTSAGLVALVARAFELVMKVLPPFALHFLLFNRRQDFRGVRAP